MSLGIDGRWVALDRLRALAVLLMIQGHAFFALLDPVEQEGGWYRLHKLFHGMTAPMFLMGAGLAFGITTYGNWEKFHHGGEAHASRLRRYLMIAALGYVLQLPSMSLGLAWNATPDAWARVIKVGPLQLIGVSLFLAQLGTRLTARPSVHAAVAGALAIAIAFAAPLTWNLDPESIGSIGLTQWIQGGMGSPFPAFPWASFLLGGMALSSANLWQATARWLRSGWVWAALGAVACGVTYTLYKLKVNPYGEHDFWRASPLYTIFRGGGVALWLALCSMWASRKYALDRGLAVMARHSLLAYVAHLVLLYGAYPLPGMMHAFGKRTLSVEAATAAALLLIAATLGILTFWHRMQKQPRVCDYTRLSLAVACLLMVLR